MERKRRLLTDKTSGRDEYDIAQIEHHPIMMIEADSADNHIDNSIVVTITMFSQVTEMITNLHPRDLDWIATRR